MKDIIEKLRLESIEHLFVLSNEWNVIHHELGDVSNVEISTKILEANSNCILFHNHPKGTSFSLSDIQNIIEHNYERMILVTPDYIYQVIRPSKNWNINIYELENELKLADLWANDQIEKLIKDGLITESDAHIEKSHYIWRIIFQLYDVNYSKKKIQDFYRKSDI